MADVKQKEQVEEHDEQVDEAAEAELAAELGIAPTEEGEPKPKPAAAPAKDAKDKPDAAKADGADEAFDPLADEDEPAQAKDADDKPASDAPEKGHQLDKGLQDYQQRLGTVERMLERLTEAVLKRDEKPTAQNQQQVENLSDQAQAKIKRLLDDGMIDRELGEALQAIAGNGHDSSLKEQLAKANERLEAMERRSMLDQARRDFDGRYPDLAGQYTRAAEKAWKAADELYPNAADDDPAKAGYAYGKLHDIAKAATARIRQRKASAGAPGAIDAAAASKTPSSKPDTSTQGARVASQGAARPNQPAAATVSEAEQARQTEAELEAELFG